MEQINLKKDYITKDKLREICRNNGIKVSERMLSHYKFKNVIEPSIMLRTSGRSGSISFYKKNTPKILYIIKNIKKEGYRIMLKDIKYLIDILESIGTPEYMCDELKKIKEEDRIFNEDALMQIGITKKNKEYLLKNIPFKLLNIKNLITKLDILKRITELEKEFKTKTKRGDLEWSST